jgi:hypothetical protein
MRTMRIGSHLQSRAASFRPRVACFHPLSQRANFPRDRRPPLHDGGGMCPPGQLLVFSSGRVLLRRRAAGGESESSDSSHRHRRRKSGSSRRHGGSSRRSAHGSPERSRSRSKSRDRSEPRGRERDGDMSSFSRAQSRGIGDDRDGGRVYGMHDDDRRSAAPLGGSVGAPRTNPYLMGERIRNTGPDAVEVVYGYEEVPARPAAGMRERSCSVFFRGAICDAYMLQEGLRRCLAQHGCLHSVYRPCCLPLELLISSTRCRHGCTLAVCVAQDDTLT